MKTIIKAFAAACFLNAMSGIAWCQTPCETDPAQKFQHEFRSRQNGNWDNVFTWEEYHPETHTWCYPATHRPDFAFQSIRIQHYNSSGRSDTVTITSEVFADQIYVEAGARLIIRPGPQNNGRLIVTNDLIDNPDLAVEGDLTVEGGLTGGRFELQTGARAEINVGGKFITLEGVLESIPVSSGVINNLGDIFIEGSFQREGGLVTGNSFRYGAGGRLSLPSSSGTVIESDNVFWPATEGPTHVDVGGPLALNAPRTLPSIYVAAPVSGANNLTVTGKIQIDRGGSFDSSPMYGDNATLHYSGWRNSHNVGPEWANGASVGRGVPQNVRIGFFAVDSTVVYMPNGPRRCPGNLELIGKLVLNSAPGANLSVGGNWGESPWTNNGGVLIPNSQTVVFDGAAEQMLFAPVVFDALTLDNSSGVSVLGSISGDILKVNHMLTFVSGNLRLYGYHSSIPWASDLVLIGEVFGASPLSHVVSGPNGSGRVLRAIAGGDSFQFPIGPTESSYNPVTIALDPLDSTETFSVRVDSTINPETPDPSLCVQRTWDISEATPGGNHAALTFQWSSTEEGANFTRNKSSTYHYTWGGYVEVASNGEISGMDPFTVSSTGGFPCTEFSSPYLSSYIIGSFGGLTAVEESENEFPTSFALSQNYPNPFNPTTVIGYAVPIDTEINLGVYNTLGQKIAALVEGRVRKGYHEVSFDASQLASGMYLCRMQAGIFVTSIKLLLSK